MKLIFHDLEDLTLQITSNPNLTTERPSGNVRSASFILDGKLELEQDQELTGIVTMMSDDDMLLRDFVVADFLRYELSVSNSGSEEVPIYRTHLLLTQTPIPEPVPEPEPPTPEELLAQAKAGKSTMIENSKNEAIKAGIDVETAYGVEHFMLNDQDLTMLLGIYSLVQQGATAYPWHSLSPESNINNICVVYSDEDIGKIAAAAFGYVTFCESYGNMLIQWLNRETDVDVVNTIRYGATLPTDLQDYLNMILMSAGLDPAVFAAAFAQPETESEGETEGEPEEESAE